MKAGDTHKSLEDNMALKGVYNVHREASLTFAVPVVAIAVPAVVIVVPAVAIVVPVVAFVVPVVA